MTLQKNMVMRSRLGNLLRTALFMAGLLVLLGLLGWYFAGPLGLIVLTGFFAVSMSTINRIPPRLVLRLNGARPLHPFEHPAAHGLVEWLARRAGLPGVPVLYLMPGPMQNALTLGTESSAAIGVTAGILRRYTDRELAGILAHEISHIRNRDTVVMGVAAVTARFTALLSQIGLFLLLFNLPLVLLGYAYFPWPLVLLFLFAPAANLLLTLGLSRTREFEADLEAANLTGDPEGLASALYRLEEDRRPWWARLLIPMGRASQATWLRSHPPTKERIRRLLNLARPEVSWEPRRSRFQGSSLF